MATVPSAYVRNKRIDYDAELLCALGHSLQLGAVELPPPPIGVFSLLEVIASRWYADRANASLLDYYRVAYICGRREACAREVVQFAKSGAADNAVDLEDAATWAAWDWQVIPWATAQDEEGAFLLDHAKLLQGEFDAWVALAFGGYDMLPASTANEVRDYLFDANTAASVAKLLCVNLNVSWFDAIWRVPLCLAGHVAAVCRREEGEDKVKRPYDVEDMHRKVDEADERERAGKLHSWQVLYPELYPLTKTQIAANPAIFSEFDHWQAYRRANGQRKTTEALKEAGIWEL